MNLDPVMLNVQMSIDYLSERNYNAAADKLIDVSQALLPQADRLSPDIKQRIGYLLINLAHLVKESDAINDSVENSEECWMEDYLIGRHYTQFANELIQLLCQLEGTAPDA